MDFASADIDLDVDIEDGPSAPLSTVDAGKAETGGDSDLMSGVVSSSSSSSNSSSSSSNSSSSSSSSSSNSNSVAGSGVKIIGQTTAFPTSKEALYAAAVALKNEGNALFKAGDAQGAVRKYRKIFAYTNGTENAHEILAAQSTADGEKRNAPPLTEDNRAFNELKKTAYCNLAMVYLKLDKADKAATAALRAIKLDDKCTKAHFRLGQALVKLNKMEKAKESLLTAARQEPQDRAIRSELESFKVAFKAWQEREKMITKELFSGKVCI